MSSVSFQNSQNVNIQLQKATVTRRIGACLLDMLLIASVYGLPILMFSDFKIFVGIWAFIMTLVTVSYNLLSEIFLEGQSIGKRWMEIRVVSIDGKSTTLSQYAIRWVFRLIDIGLLQGGVAVFTILIGGKGQRLGDIVAGTIVISEKKKVKKSQFAIQEFPEDYQVVFPQADALSDDQVKLLKKVISLEYTTEHQMIILKLEKKLKEQLALETTMKGKKFLKQLLDDYYFTTIVSQKELL